MSDFIQETSDEQFDNDVIQSELPVLVDFWAEWCGPCKAIAPVLNEIAKEYQGRVNFYKVNIDENSNTPARFGVRSIPTLLLFKTGGVVATNIGTKSRSQLLAFIDENI